MKRILVRSKSYAIANQSQLEADWAIISILDPGKPRIFSSEYSLTLWFDDAEEKEPAMFELPPDSQILLPVYFTPDMATEIKKFVDVNADKDFFIHCTLGKCRSGAVGEILADYFKIPYEQFKRWNPQTQPNTLVRTTLFDTFFHNINSHKL